MSCFQCILALVQAKNVHVNERVNGCDNENNLVTY